MKKVSKETNFAFIFTELFVILGCDLWSLSWWAALWLPFAYLIMLLLLKVYVWDKKKQFEMLLSYDGFRKGDLIRIASTNKDAIVMGRNVSREMFIKYTLYPFKKSKYKIVNRFNSWWITFTYNLRNKSK